MAQKKGAGGKPQEFDTEDGRYGKSSTTDYSEYDFPQYLARTNGNEGRKKETTAAVGFANKERKNTKHHLRHAREMGYKNQDEYERAAVEFFNGNSGKLYYNPKDNRYYRYDDKTRRIAVCDAEGNIHTFFVARKGWINTIKGLQNV
ncbi:MAG: hypothetical protein HFE28_01355 [Clostridia bacterium]|nr:hypothetical protein [Clostridia bacterium]